MTATATSTATEGEDGVAGTARRLRGVARRALGALGLERSGRPAAVAAAGEGAAGARHGAGAAASRGGGVTEAAGRIAALADELDALRAAQAEGSGRDRPDLQYLFVVTYGRSGSTLLQGILNSVPGVTVRGENGGLLLDLYRMHTTATGHRERLRERATAGRAPVVGHRRVPRPAGVPRVPEPPAGDGATARPGHPHGGVQGDRLGPRRHARRAAGGAGVHRQVFPGARFVLNTRDLVDVAQSKWWADRPDALERLRDMERQLVDALAPFGDDVYRVHYSWPTRRRRSRRSGRGRRRRRKASSASTNCPACLQVAPSRPAGRPTTCSSRRRRGCGC